MRGVGSRVGSNNNKTEEWVWALRNIQVQNLTFSVYSFVIGVIDEETQETNEEAAVKSLTQEDLAKLRG